MKRVSLYLGLVFLKYDMVETLKCNDSGKNDVDRTILRFLFEH